jgi:hypothetical protein
MLTKDWPAEHHNSSRRERRHCELMSGLYRALLMVLLSTMAGETAFADIIHMCLEGVYYQVSPTQGKYQKMGTCGPNNWTYRQQTDELLFTVPPTPGTVPADVQSVINRWRGVVGVPIPESNLTGRSYQNVTNLIPQGSDEQTITALRSGSPRPCQPGERPPCGWTDCSGLSPSLCRLMRGLGGPTVSVAVSVGPVRNIPIRIPPGSTSGLQLTNHRPGSVENCYFPPCRSEPEFPYAGVLVGSRAGATIAVVDALEQTVTSARIDGNGEFVIPAPVARRGRGPYRICILHPQTPIKCGPVDQKAPRVQDGTMMLQVVGKPAGLPRPNPTNPNPR